MSNKPATHANDASGVSQCARLREFQEFLRECLHVESGGNGGGEPRSCVTRGSNETYVVTQQEFRAEVIMAVWKKLQAKHCPRYFQLALLRLAVAEIEQHCGNTKECEFTCAHAKETVDKDLQQYDLVKLQKYVTNYLEKLLTRLADNMEADNLKNYADVNSLCQADVCNCIRQQQPETTRYIVGHIKNKPRKMEDRHVCLERYSDMYQLKQPSSFYGVFDGHCGSWAATYAACQLPYLLAQRLKETDSSVDAYREAFETCFLEADEMFAQKLLSSGTTAVCALITQMPRPHLYVGWVGDSKALLVGVCASLQLVKPHNPDVPDERQRIESADAEAGGCGGAVMYVQGHWRVNGILNVSRSIGDYAVKAVIAEPDFVDVALTTTHDFLILGTDGLWDHVEETVITETVYSALANGERSDEDIPKMLIELAKQGGSQDNITVVIVFLKERFSIVESYRSK